MTSESLVDIIDHLINRGTVLLGRSTISVADVDLVDLELQLVLSSIETLDQGRGELEVPEPGREDSASPGRELSDRRMGARHAPSPDRISSTTSSPTPSLEPRRERQSPTVGGPTPRADRLQAQKPILPGPLEGEPPERGLARLALTVVDILRQVVERQAVRRMEGGRLRESEVERMGVALMELEAKMAEIRDMFGLEQGDLDLDLGPLDRLLA